MIATMTLDTLETSSALDAQGFTCRNWRADADFEKMSRVLIASKNADELPEGRTADDLSRMYARMKNFDARQNLFLVEQDGELVAYAGCRWFQENNAKFIHGHWIFVLPEFRGRGIENELLSRVQRRLYEYAAVHPENAECWFETEAADSQAWLSDMVEADGYQAARYFFDMLRANLENIPEAALPAGIETRPVKPDDMRKIYYGGEEAFADDWSAPIVEEGDFERWLKKEIWKPKLWQIAWDGDEFVGMILNHVDESENKQYGYKRGHTEDIAVRKPWRRRGVATALLVRSLKMFRDMGFDSTALGVDTQNPNDALHLYESVGYKTVRRFTIYRKRMADRQT